MEESLVSVIVPVFNTGQYVEKCLRSIIDQTYNHLEILVIDDGSTDSSGNICDRMAEEDSRIRIVHQTNAGVSSARNKGLDLCSGSYVLFVDSDDWIEPQMVELMVSAIDKTNTDLAVCQINDVYLQGDGSLLIKKRNILVKYENNSKIGIHEFYLRVFCHSGTIWNKMFKRDVIAEKRLPTDKTIGEDSLFCLDILENVKSSVVVAMPLYNYRRERKDSIMSKLNYHSCLEYLENSVIQYKILSVRGVPEAGINRICIAINAVLRNIPANIEAQKRYSEYKEKCHKVAREPSFPDTIKYYASKEFTRRQKLYFAMHRMLPEHWITKIYSVLRK